MKGGVYCCFSCEDIVFPMKTKNASVKYCTAEELQLKERVHSKMKISDKLKIYPNIKDV